MVSQTLTVSSLWPGGGLQGTSLPGCSLCELFGCLHCLSPSFTTIQRWLSRNKKHSQGEIKLFLTTFKCELLLIEVIRCLETCSALDKSKKEWYVPNRHVHIENSNRRRKLHLEFKRILLGPVYKNNKRQDIYININKR